MSNESKQKYDKVMICPKCSHSLDNEATQFTAEDGTTKVEFYTCEHCGAYVTKDLVKEVFIKRAEPVKPAKVTVYSLNDKLDKIIEMLSETKTEVKEQPLIRRNITRNNRPSTIGEIITELNKDVDFGKADIEALLQFFGMQR